MLPLCFDNVVGMEMEKEGWIGFGLMMCWSIHVPRICTARKR